MPCFMEIVRFFDFFWKVGQIFRLAIGECLALISYDIADAFTVHSFRDPMDIVWTIWGAFAEIHAGGRLPDLPSSIIRSIDQCKIMSDAALRYGCDIDNSVAYQSRLANPLFSLLDDYKEIPPQELENALGYLCNIGYDIEERNCEGATLLLFEAAQLSQSVVSILRFLIRKGADVHAVDTQNRGALHCALRAPEDWGTWNSSCTDSCEHFDSDHEDWTYFLFRTESEAYADDYCDDGLTPVPSVINHIPNDRLACDDEAQERLYLAAGGVCFPTTGLTGSASHSARSRSEHYIDLDEAEDVDRECVEDVEGDGEEEHNGGGKEDGEDGEDDEDDEDDGDDGDDEALEIPEGYVLCNDEYGISHIIRKPLLILKTRLRFKLLTLLRAGCNPNLLDDDGSSPSDDAEYHGLWPEWTWALLNVGYVVDENSNRWVKRVEDEVSFGQ